MRDDIIQIRWHGRGGQGAITAAKIVANAAFSSGYSGVVMTPTFGTERRGAPVLTSLKIAKDKIYDLSPISEPDMVMVFDSLLLTEVGVTNGLRSGGLMMLNSPRPPAEYANGSMTVATADVTSFAAGAGLPTGIINTGMIGLFAKATGLLDLDILLEAVGEEFTGRNPEKNIEAARAVYKNTMIGES
ncbi:MAG: 2-oxoacid:acceptor oxidoreductase family protein [Desulfosalsimonadaceae bacterium]